MLTYVCTWKNPHSWEAIPDNQEAHTHTPPSVVIVIVLGDEDVVLLQQCGKVLADLSPHIQEGHHYQSNPDKAEGGLLPRSVSTPHHRNN